MMNLDKSVKQAGLMTSALKFWVTRGTSTYNKLNDNVQLEKNPSHHEAEDITEYSTDPDEGDKSLPSVTKREK